MTHSKSCLFFFCSSIAVHIDHQGAACVVLYTVAGLLILCDAIECLQTKIIPSSQVILPTIKNVIGNFCECLDPIREVRKFRRIMAANTFCHRTAVMEARCSTTTGRCRLPAEEPSRIRKNYLRSAGLRRVKGRDLIRVHTNAEVAEAARLSETTLFWPRRKRRLLLQRISQLRLVSLTGILYLFFFNGLLFK